MHLPPELYLEVFQHLTKKDLKAVRLTCRVYELYVNCCLFDTVYISCHQLDYDVYAKIARHPIISACVKNLRYDTCQFPPMLTKKVYLQKLANQIWYLLACDRKPPYSTQDPEAHEMLCLINEYNKRNWVALYPPIWQKFQNSYFVEVGYRRFMQHAHRQQLFRGSTEYWKQISEKIRLLANLKSVEVYDQWCSVVKSYHGSLLISTYGDILPESSPLARSWNVLHLRPSYWNYNMMGPKDADGAIEFGIMNYLLLNAHQRLRCLNINRSSTGLTAATWSPENETCATLIAASFWPYARFEVLKLRISSLDKVSDSELRPITGLQELLSCTPRLQRLELVLENEHGVYHDTCYTLEQVFPATPIIWRDLQFLYLGYLQADAASLMRLLMADMPRLSSLSLSHIELVNGRWEYVIALMQRCLTLSSFRASPGWDLIYPGGKAV